MKTLSMEKTVSLENRVSSTLEEQRYSYSKIREGKPLEAEDDTGRKLAYIQKQIPVSEQVAKQIADYQPAESLPLTPQQQKKAESIQGNTVDFMGIAFLDLAKAAAKPVGRVIFDDGDPQGTGFMISPSLFITNNHVISSREQCQQFLLQFNYEEDYRKFPQPTSEFRLDPDAFFLTAPEDDLDFTIVAIGDRVSGQAQRAQLGFLPLFESTDRHIMGMFVNCIQHPSGGTKQLVVRENHLLARTTNTLIYGSDTEPGSSGSPVFNDNWEVIGLHHWGEPYRALTDQFEGLPKSGNEAIRISSVVKFLKNQHNLSAAMQTLLSEALAIRFHLPSPIVEPVSQQAIIAAAMPARSQPREATSMEPPQPKPVDAPISEPIKIKQMENQSLSFTIPLTISISVGNLPVAAQGLANPAAGPVEHSAAEKLVPDADYKNRKGYNPAFLGIVVPLPQLSPAQNAIAAQNLWVPDSVEFKYQHFTVVMNANRKLAFFTAVNIDGASVVKIDRDTGVVTRGPESVSAEGAEGREKWYADKRILDEQVCEDKLYTSYDEMKVFQRGHLVKRTDPSWGTEARAIKGQADTFHFLNCAPQHFKFNPIKTKWAGVEDWITNTSDDENIRVSVFSGPVFTGSDPQGGYIQIPKTFWKVVIWAESGKLRATGIIADQSKLLQQSGFDITDRPSGAESLDRLPDNLPGEYHCSIKYLEEITGLGFFNLSEFDTYSSSGAEGHHSSAIRVLKTYAQLLGS